jgi:peptide/nickel transport system substrate-binding protein
MPIVSTAPFRQPRQRWFRSAAALTVTSALLLAGCSGGSSGDTSQEGQGAQADQSLTVGIPTDINPTNFLGVLSANEPVGRLIFEPLVDFDAEAGEYVPWLASGWEFSADGLSLTVDLRDDVVFHGGRALTAQDVVASVEAAKAPDSGAQAAGLLARATAVEATGDHQVLFTFAEPTAESFLDALVWMRVVDPETLAGLKSGESVVGTGPFVWTGWTPGSEVTLEANPDYWGGAPEVDDVTLKVYGQSQAMLAALRSGQIDVAHRMVPRDVETVANDSKLRVETFDPFAETYVGVDVTVEPFDDPKVRQALAWAMDRERIAEQVFSGYAQPTDLPLPPSSAGLDSFPTDTYGYDADKAKQMIEDAGATGATVSLAALSTDPILAAVRDVVQFNLTEIGLNVEPVSWDAAQVPERLGSGTTGGLWVNRVSSGSLSPASMAATLLPYRPGKNASNVNDPAYAQLAKAAESATPEDNQALAQYLVDQAWHLTLVQTQNPLVVRSEVEGVELDTNGYLDLTGASVG